MTREYTIVDFWLQVLAFAVSTLGIHFGLGVVWGWSAFWGFILALFGYVLIVIVLDGDGSIW